MILHTIVCHEQIFPNENESQYESRTQNGVPVIVERAEDKYRIVRIMSTNPNDFLKAELSPGTYIE